MTEAYELGAAKLESSGLTMDDAMALGIEILSADETAARHSSFKPLPSLYLPYWDPRHPAEPSRPMPKWPQFYRIRYLKEDTGFGALANKKPLRYVQEPESGVCAYFPRLELDWSRLLADSTQPLIITEGELKAAKACREGYPTIGLGGVSNYQSARLGLAMISDLASVNWVKRHVYLCYDSDYRSNPNICNALNALAERLMLEGAFPYLLPLPDVLDGQKTGLDDFLCARPPSDLADLLKDACFPLTLARPLHQLNDRVTYVHNPGLIVVHESGQKLSAAQFKDQSFASTNYTEQVVRENGSISLRPAAAGTAWIKWPLRREVGQLTYAPGRPTTIVGSTVLRSSYNTWPGWGVAPEAGDVSMFKRLIDHLFPEPVSKQWFLRWCAYPLRYPGVKMFTSAVIHGRVHGTGKSMIGYTLGRIYGKNFTEIKQSDLHANFNEWAENKQFVLGDDVTGSDRRADADMLKKLITQRELRLNPKYIPSYVVPDCINYLWTSNQPDAFFLEDGDRRFFIHEVSVQPLSEEFYLDYDLWLDTGGSQAVFDYLLKLDLGDFNPAAPALKTLAKARMTEDVRSDLGSWVRQLKEDPGSVLRVGDIALPGDLFTNRYLLKIYDPTERTRTTANGLGRELRRAGFQQVKEGAPIHTDQGLDRFYIIRNEEKWLKASLNQIKAHIDGPGRSVSFTRNV